MFKWFKGPALIYAGHLHSDPFRPVEGKGLVRTLLDLPTGLTYLPIPADIIQACQHASAYPCVMFHLRTKDW